MSVQDETHEPEQFLDRTKLAARARDDVFDQAGHAVAGGIEGGVEAHHERPVDRELGAPRRRRRCLELRATVSLTRLWHRQRQSSKARRVLTRIYSDFAEGFADADLTEARALLDGSKSTSR